MHLNICIFITSQIIIAILNNVLQAYNIEYMKEDDVQIGETQKDKERN